MSTTAAEIARGAHGTLVAGDPDARVTSWAFDSRALEPGACFAALRDHRDGHDFLAHAFHSGAAVALVSRDVPGVVPPDGAAIVRVADVVEALQVLATAARRARPGLRVVGVGGSTGKTSTKDLLAAALAPLGCHASPASYNNEFGLPITILDAPVDVRVIVAEMGERVAGDVDRLCAIAQPEIGVVTNVGLAHAEHLGGPRGAAAAIGELVASLPPDGLAVLNADDEWTPDLAARSRATVVTVGYAPDADYPIERVELDERLRPTFTLAGRRVAVALHGEHQVVNAALALVAAHRGLGMDLDEAGGAMGDVRPARWRLELHRTGEGVTVLNDAYNANPASMHAALEALARAGTRGRRIAVLGDMRELGTHSHDAHVEIGRRVAELDLDVVIGVGDGGKVIVSAAATGGAEAFTAEDALDALRIVAELAAPGDAVLVKASRAVGLEVVAEGLIVGGADTPGAAS